MGKKPRRGKAKRFNSAYAITQDKLPRCGICGRGFVTLKAVNFERKTVMACDACRRQLAGGPSGAIPQ